MSNTALFALLGGLLVLAFAANRLFHRTRVPDVMVLMAVGLLIGPVFRLIDPAKFAPVTHAFGTLAVILILFEAGLDLDLHDTLRHFPGGMLLAVAAYAISLGLVAFVLVWSMDLSMGGALLAAAALACTSSSITLPILQQLEISKPARVTLLLEASLSDALAVLTIGILMDLGNSFGSVMSSFALSFLFQVTVSLLLAFIVASVWSYVLPKLSDKRFWQVLTFAVVLLLYAGAERVHANGLITVLCFGLALANLRRIDSSLLESSLGLDVVTEEHHTQMLSFHSELAFLVRTFFFVMIGVVVNLERMLRLLPILLGVVGAVMVARWLAILVSRWSWKGLKPIEREVVFWIMPRGLITVVLALQVASVRGAELSFLPGLAFAAILATNVLVIVGSIRARRAPAQSLPVEAQAVEVASGPPPGPGAPS